MSENAEIVRRIHANWAQGKPPWTHLELYDPDVTWTMPHPGLSAQGRDELLQIFRRYLGTWDEFEIQLDEIRELPGGRVLAFFSERMRSRGAGVPTETHAAAIWTLAEGRVVEYRAYADRAEALAAAGVEK